MSKEVGYRDATASKNGYGLCTLFSCIHRILALFIIIILFFCKKQNESPALASLDSHSPAACWSTCGHCSPGQPDRKGGDVGQIGGGGEGGVGKEKR